MAMGIPESEADFMDEHQSKPRRVFDKSWGDINECEEKRHETRLYSDSDSNGGKESDEDGDEDSDSVLGKWSPVYGSDHGNDVF